MGSTWPRLHLQMLRSDLITLRVHSMLIVRDSPVSWQAKRGELEAWLSDHDGDLQEVVAHYKKTLASLHHLSVAMPDAWYSLPMGHGVTYEKHESGNGICWRPDEKIRAKWDAAEEAMDARIARMRLDESAPDAEPKNPADDSRKLEVLLSAIDDDTKQILLILNGEGTADEKMRRICAIDHRKYLAWKSPQWAAILGVTTAAVRLTEFWKDDRNAAIEVEREKQRDLAEERNRL